jgi:curved DNA-binding protein CbpA
MPRLADELMTVREAYPKGPMRTLYDLLGARPDEDAEGLRDAFRKAMASRASLHTGDPDAPDRFRQLVEAYDIVRNAERRAAYDRLLEFERGRVYSKLKYVVSHGVHNIVLDTISVVSLVIVLAGGHALFAYMSETPVDAVEWTTGRPAEVAGIRPAGSSIAEPDQPHGKLERVTVAKTDNAFAARVDQDRTQPEEIQLSSKKKDRDVAKSPLFDSAKSDDKSHAKIRETRRFNMHDMKIPEMKIARKRQARDLVPVKHGSLENAQASLENIKTFSCSGPQACSSEPPVLGVGF